METAKKAVAKKAPTLKDIMTAGKAFAEANLVYPSVSAGAVVFNMFRFYDGNVAAHCQKVVEAIQKAGNKVIDDRVFKQEEIYLHLTHVAIFQPERSHDHIAVIPIFPGKDFEIEEIYLDDKGVPHISENPIKGIPRHCSVGEDLSIKYDFFGRIHPVVALSEPKKAPAKK